MDKLLNHIQRDMFSDELKSLDLEVSFVIDYYDIPEALYHKRPVPACFYNFPSARAAIAWLNDNLPEVFYFRVDICHEPVKCPEKYMLIL